MGFWHPFELAHQEIIQPLAGRILIDFDRFHFRAAGGRIAPYNVFH
jgi:hypothetical protein